MLRSSTPRTLGVALLGALAAPAFAQPYNTPEASQVSGLAGYQTRPIFTVGETIDGYIPPGILDGLGAYALDANTVRVLANHELTASAGYAYTLANGTQLTGARVSYFDLNRQNGDLLGSGLAYDTVIDRYGNVVTSATQINEGTSTLDGFDRLCSSALFEAGSYGLVDDLYFTGEETTNGQVFVLEIATGVMHAAPMLGRFAWENATLIDSGDPNTVAIVIGDDAAARPLWLYLGQKDGVGDGSFLDRNGLAVGTLYAYKADDPTVLTPEQFNGTGRVMTGSFVEVEQFDPAMAGQPGYDAAGYADGTTLVAEATADGAFLFSRPEDLSTDPNNDRRIVLASTGRGSIYPSDTWGDTYLITFATGAPVTATVLLAYDGDDGGDVFPHPDLGLRSPDNLTWAARDRRVYVQEDRATEPSSLFGSVSGTEASIWASRGGVPQRVAVVNRAAVPADQIDSAPTDIGNWETSGIIDVSGLFGAPANRIVLIGDVQAHSLNGGRVAANNLVEGGQLFFLSKRFTTVAAMMAEGETSTAEVEVEEGVVPTAYALVGAQPNPAAGETNIVFEAPDAARVRVTVYDVLGKQIAVLLDGEVEAGRYRVAFDASDLPSGVYVVRMETPQGVLSQRMSVLR